MTLHFSNIIIHHFKSIEHAEVDFKDKGYCLVKGINKNPKDSARSNGSGKSSLFDALSYVLTGETLQGLHSNLPNIAFDDGCYVILEFDVDGHKYKLIRSKDDKQYKTNLKIFIDGEDKSGPGIKDSQKLLEQYLPDITSELLGSVVLIGQNMPMKFTANSPSGRKEVLEHLSQSDFMIQDLKDRLARRSDNLALEVRAVEDNQIRYTSTKEVLDNQMRYSNEEYEKRFSITPDFYAQILSLTEEKTNSEKELENLKKQFDEKSKSKDELMSISNKKLEERDSKLNLINDEHQKAVSEFNDKNVKLSTRKQLLESEITRLESIKDVCPTCGQKIPNVIKPDTSAQHAELDKVKSKINSLMKEKQLDDADYTEIVKKIHDKFDADIKQTADSFNTLSRECTELSSKINTINSAVLKLSGEINKKMLEKDSFEKDKATAVKNIEDLHKKIKESETNIENESQKREILKEHESVLSKMNTIIKRDFRGLLLNNIITYIESKAKEYALKVFGCDELEFALDGNDINISFCKKDYENLSGGEKRRVDIIVQFALRDFLCNYLQFSSNILVLDEITDELDAESCDKVINFITTEMRDVESVFIISHHENSLELPVDSELVIEKNELGVSNVIYQG